MHVHLVIFVTHAHASMCMCTHVQAHMPAHMCKHMQAHVQAHACKHAHTCASTCMHTYVPASRHVCMQVPAHLCMHACKAALDLSARFKPASRHYRPASGPLQPASRLNLAERSKAAVKCCAAEYFSSTILFSCLFLAEPASLLAKGSAKKAAE